MTKTLVICGAGVGIGASVAHRFGREGYRVGLVGRRQQRLHEVASGLQAAGIDCATFPADLGRPDVARGLVRDISTTLGEPDVLHYGPLAGDQQFYPAVSLTVPIEQHLLDLFFLTPVALIAEILPGMIDRGRGAILVTQGRTATDPIPGLSGVGPAMAATHNYVRSLFAELAGKGVYAGTLTLRAGVQRSEMYTRLHAGANTRPPGPSVDPDDVADLLWTMFVNRDQAAAEYPAPGGSEDPGDKRPG
jgi:short-subunit dehydrogenase